MEEGAEDGHRKRRREERGGEAPPHIFQYAIGIRGKGKRRTVKCDG